MKKLLFLMFSALSFSMAQSDNVDSTFSDVWYYRDTLTVAIDTIDIAFVPSSRYSYHTIMAYNPTSGADTVEVYALSLDGSTWSRRAVTDETTGSTTTAIITSTTPKEWILYDTKPQKVRLISTSNDGSTTIFLLGIKK